MDVIDLGCPIPMCLSYERAGVGHYWSVLQDIAVGLVSQTEPGSHTAFSEIEIAKCSILQVFLKQPTKRDHLFK